MDVTQVLIGAPAAVAAIVAAVFAYRASAQANLTAVKKVDAEAFERTQVIYEKAIAGAERELVRLQTQHDRMADQLDRVNARLAQEQDSSNALRNEIRSLHGQVQAMDNTIGALRGQLTSAGHPKRPP